MTEKGNVQSKGTLTIMVIKGPYVTEAADMAAKTALAAQRMGYEVNIFLYLDGVWTAHLSGDKEFNNPGDWLKRAVRKGIRVKMCERCTKARDLSEDKVIKGITIPGSYELFDMLQNSDKVLTFGG